MATWVGVEQQPFGFYTYEQAPTFLSRSGQQNLKVRFFRRGLTCTIGLTNDLIDGGRPRAKNGF